MDSIKYIYFGNTKKSKHYGILTIAYRYDHDSKAIEYALAFCSPRDRFSRKIGRRISKGRLENGFVYRIFDVEPSKGYKEPQYRVCLDQIREDIIKLYNNLWLEQCPHWFTPRKVFPGEYVLRAK